ncbi:tRNA lysidine(34) synthetase TilS [Hamadaea sp.]|uniref:tRNA lysidine(34) synthetase TilS n=1 Tax=Hamadaea sp. TaxID=2024425 RepID=UPI0025BC489B|nr:tRNA lysidine(34) synthetase TilS [Hamadaea sp.]
MTGPHPSVAQTRTAVRRALGPGENRLALVACSGGADSLALAAAAAFAGPRLGWRIGLVTVDHNLQAGSAERAAAVAAWAADAGLTPAIVAPVTIDPADPVGPEAAARHARYEALLQQSEEYAAAALLLGHTLDDQAETVLLALARGAGPRGLAGMPARREVDGVAVLRPMLGVRRTTLREACAEQGLTPWEDPHNSDDRYARARVRSSALPALVTALGPGVVGNLAQTAAQLAADASYLDGLAATAYAECRSGSGLSVDALRALPDALRGRVLHTWALELGAPGAALGHRHVAALDALVTAWHGQGPTALPGGIEVHREDGRLLSR